MTYPEPAASPTEMAERGLFDFLNGITVLLFYPVDFASIRLSELVEAAAYYDEFRKGGAEILAVSMNTTFVSRAWPANSPAIPEIGCPRLVDPTEICRYFRTHMEALRLLVRGTFIIDPNGVLKARAFTTRTSAGLAG